MSMALKASKGQVYGSGLAGGPLSTMAAGQYSRRAYMGDPGLFGFLGKAVGGIAKTVGGILPGPVGGAIGALGGALAGSRRQSPSIAQVPMTNIQERQRDGFVIPFPGPGGMRVNPRAAAPGGAPLFQRELQQQNGGKAPSGYHWNKTSYFLKDGTFVPEGSKLVKNRRRNPLNPKAASRAISRLESAKKATKRLDRIKIKCRRCGYTSCRCKG